MVNLTIRLNKAGSNSGSKAEHNLLEADESSLAPHLVEGDLPVVKGIGFLHPGSCRINLVGVKVQRKPGSRVHICRMCNFPIAVYGRMDPCQHVLCFACTRRDSKCFICKEKVTRIQQVDVLVGLFICGVPGCLRSFLVRPDFELHVAKDHSQPREPEPSKAGVSTGKAGQSQIQSQNADLMIPPPNSCASLQATIPRKEDVQRGKDEKSQPRRYKWEPSRQGQNVREIGKDQGHEGYNYRDRGGEYGRKRERERGTHPPNTFLACCKQQLRHVPSLLPPTYSQAFPALHEPNAGYPLRGEFFAGRAMPPRQDSNVLVQHPEPRLGMQQQGEWQVVTLIPQSVRPDVLRSMQPPPQVDGFKPPQIRPHFLSDQFGHPMGLTDNVFHPHQQHGLPVKRTMTLKGPRPSLGELIVDFGWGPGNLNNFAGGPSGGHVVTGWLPAANS